MAELTDPTSLKVNILSRPLSLHMCSGYVEVLQLHHYTYEMTEVFVNKYKATEASIPKGIHESTPLEEYDFNYCFEIKTLRSDRVELRPFLVRTSAFHCLDQLTYLIAFYPCQAVMGSLTAQSRLDSVVGKQALDML